MESIHEHLKSRHLDMSLYQGIYVDEESYSASFTLRNVLGDIVGVQTYKPLGSKTERNLEGGKYHTRFGIEGDVNGKKRAKHKIGFFGVETLDYGGPVFLSEGIFDIVRIHNLGFSGLALLSNDPKHMRDQIERLRRPFITICDSGTAGLRLAKYGNDSIVVSDYVEADDLGDCTEEQIKTLTETEIFKECYETRELWRNLRKSR